MRTKIDQKLKVIISSSVRPDKKSVRVAKVVGKKANGSFLVEYNEKFRENGKERVWLNKDGSYVSIWHTVKVKK